jgi:hypothetical protein
MKKKERDQEGRMVGGAQSSTLLSIFDRLCQKASKTVLEEFFKDECCRMLFKRYWNQIYKQGYEPCEKRAFTRNKTKRRTNLEQDEAKG